MSGMAHVPPPAPADSVAAWRLFATLGIGGAVAGVAIVVAYGLTLPTIERNKAARVRAAVEEVLKAPARFDTLYVAGGALRDAPPAAASEQVFVGYAADGRRVGFAITAAEPGFADVVRLMFGYDPDSRELLGMTVLESKETPGLGDKIEKNRQFVAQFAGVATPLRGVKAGKRSGDPHEVDMITGATISSRTVIRAINRALDRFGPMIDAYLAAELRR